MSGVDGNWFKSSYSDGGGCVEVDLEASQVRLRDSKNRTGPRLTFTPHEWQAFLRGVRAGEFDLPETV